MPPEILRRLRCPVCAGPLSPAGAAPTRSLGCPHGHSFDIARQGYAHLGTGRVRHPGDSPAMVAARAAFLAAGHYDFVSTAVAEAALTGSARSAPPPSGSLVVDAGGGTGHHLAAVLAALPGAVGLVLDVSTAALRRAARSHTRAAAAYADTWGRLPLADGAASLVLNIFAPRNPTEFHRVLRPDGALVVVTPLSTHLGELAGPLGLLGVEEAKPERVAGQLGARFSLAAARSHRRLLRLDHAGVDSLVGMGPSARHIPPADLAARIAALPEPVEVTAAVRVARYTPR